ncbi:beta-amyrin 28-oxidase-like [Pyrus ussuriensis x Pyrus communis]|uniref:Beta-amyrin 28-oxidase-like n=1 Tax=Pyrus ussuriensis x Pyrus communis TaxID=2448454 RepID=A0A5N5GUB4_9ROSA|nr:beta-amyrin 28-oxidase-like [Pyrus ussuriensis x Pyrus communis]
METLYLIFSVGAAFLAFTIFALKGKSDGAKNLPPGSMGWPIVGESIEFLFGKPENFVFNRMRKSPGFLKPEALVRYLGKMDSITQEQMKAYWEGKDEVKVYPLAKTLTLSLACRFFLGIDDSERIARLVSNFDDEKKAAMAAGGPMHDILSHMIVASDPSGKHMPEAEVADKIMGLLTAGYSTVATAMTFFMKYVGERPDIYAKVLAEHKEIADSKKPGDFLDTTNMNPQYFPNPEKFDPSRYEDLNAFPAFTLVPFGGGPRMCPGKEYARLAILTFVHNVVKRFEWEVVFPKEKITGDMMPTPEKGLPVRLRRH